MAASTVQGEGVEVSSEMIEAAFAEFCRRFPDCGGYSEVSAFDIVETSSAVLWKRCLKEALQLPNRPLKLHDMLFKVCLLKG